MTANNDSMKISQNDSRWSWLNGLTQKEIQVIVRQAIQDYLDDLKSPEF
jgi:hypothetical protein